MINQEGVINLVEEEINSEIGKAEKDLVGSCPFAKIKKGPLVCPTRGEHCERNDTNLSQCAQYDILSGKLIEQAESQIRAACASCRRVEINNHWLERRDVTRFWSYSTGYLGKAPKIIAFGLLSRLPTKEIKK